MTGSSASARFVAIIADGNGRWAAQRGLPISEGHDAAADTLHARVLDAIELGVSELTVFAFSTENWVRPDGEVSQLMGMFTSRIAYEAPLLHREGVRMRFLGETDGLPERLRQRMVEAEQLTSANDTLRLFIAFNYGGRAEILQAARAFQDGGEDEFQRCLCAPDMHDPEVIIRTGGEQRLSNFLLWQSAYSELVFREELWPDFDRGALAGCLAEFAERRRRFGGR